VTPREVVYAANVDRQRGDDRSAAEETAAPGAPGQPPDGAGIGGDPLRPDERSTYDTDDATGGESSVRAAPSSPPGIVIGLVLLAIFIAILAWAVITGIR
jgi:hypothetical protein